MNIALWIIQVLLALLFLFGGGTKLVLPIDVLTSMGSPNQVHLPGLLILKAQSFAKEKGIDGYKLTFHVGPGGGQEVMYLHLHFLAQQRPPS